MMNKKQSSFGFYMMQAIVVSVSCCFIKIIPTLWLFLFVRSSKNEMWEKQGDKKI
jgi:hypothetical protein